MMYIGNNKVENIDKEVRGQLVEVHGEEYYKISHSDKMRPFFMTILSASNHWMFISSNGGVTAGRQNSESALFPYYTDDKITESSYFTGSRTLIKVSVNDKKSLWEPFSKCHQSAYHTETHLYKNKLGNKILFEEINHDLQITYRYWWMNSETYGFVKRSEIINNNDKAIIIEILDGIENILPYGVGSELQNSRSNLVDAYKKNELETQNGLGIYSLSAIIVDKAEPSESFKATTVFSCGTQQIGNYLISSLQLEMFRKDRPLKTERDIRAEKGAYFFSQQLELSGRSSSTWLTVAEVNQSMVEIAAIDNLLAQDDATEQILADVERGSINLERLAATSDALQLSADKLRNMRHFSNTVFNIMRGGVFDDNYNIERDDFVSYLEHANKEVYQGVEKLVVELPDIIDLHTVLELASNSEDVDFKRLCHEYMPLKFSRRHGDPSRPWNKFSINTADSDGNKLLDYEGNWRDIFQNWEALAYSYPRFMESMIHKFLNASTFDGYNPYRVTKGGFDWETIEPDDPWSYIGYWGDHQIIYLLKFLEFIEAHEPGRLLELINERVFVYACVPYRIKDYSQIVENPQDTIDFDHSLDKVVRDRRDSTGADGALLHSKGGIYHVNFLEKILATVLAKVSNFVPDAGIWMNTQRPEWNDANNALVGNGVSMVTLCYLHRFLDFLSGLLSSTKEKAVPVSVELFDYFTITHDALRDKRDTLSRKRNNKERRDLMDALGMAASDYRNIIYTSGFSGNSREIEISEVRDFVYTTQKFLKASIVENRREDNLYHSYNIITLKENEVAISRLPEMLEGQVAVLSSKAIDLQESLTVMDALKASALFREDQYSYILYPDKELNRFVDKNNVPAAMVEDSALLSTLIADGDNSLIQRDMNGGYHYNGSFNNAKSLQDALDHLPARYSSLKEKDESQLLQDFESLFNHKAFTGRSGTFYGYEGLGSIYWHMVSKLVLAAMEKCVEALQTSRDPKLTGRLMEHYYEMNEGIGVHKSPSLYGAFPTDAYSHTPGGKGAQQPGMTGQVKEDLLSRFFEIGIFVQEGAIQFNPKMLRSDELLKRPASFDYYDLQGRKQSIAIDAGSMVATYCQVPIVFTNSGSDKIIVQRANAAKEEIAGLNLGRSISDSLFARRGTVKNIEVHY